MLALFGTGAVYPISQNTLSFLGEKIFYFQVDAVDSSSCQKISRASLA